MGLPFSDEEMDQEDSEEKAARMRLHLGDLWNHKGKELFRTHRYAEAKEALLKAVEIKPSLQMPVCPRLYRIHEKRKGRGPVEAEEGH